MLKIRIGFAYRNADCHTSGWLKTINVRQLKNVSERFFRIVSHTLLCIIRSIVYLVKCTLSAKDFASDEHKPRKNMTQVANVVLL